MAFLAFLFCSTFTNAQFYHSVACVSGVSLNPQTGMPEGCGLPTYFFDTDTLSVSRQWDFGDGLGVATERAVNYSYQNIGTYTITLTKFYANSSTPVVYSEQISVGQAPSQPLFNKKPVADTTVCGGKNLVLDPFGLGSLPGDVSYLWFPTGDTTQSIQAESSGCYSVEVKDKTSGCSSFARINVKFCLEPPSSGGGAERWYFGDGATLEFVQTGDTVRRDSSLTEGEFFQDPALDTVAFNPSDNAGSNPLNSAVATAMVYGPSGGIAFYTDGQLLYNGQDQIVPDLSGSNPISGQNDAQQGVLLIPKTGCQECDHTQYYLYKVDKATKMLSYDIIDLRFNDSLGAVIEKNIPVAWPVSEQINAVQNSDGTGFVVISKLANSNTFNLQLVDSTGTRRNTQTIGTPYGPNTIDTGYLIVSRNGRKMARGLVINNRNYVEIYDINPDSLSLNNPVLIDLGIDAPPSIYGLTFAENDDILYATLSGEPSAGIASYLLQINLSLPDPATIAANIISIDSNPSLQFGAVKLGPVNGAGAKYVYIAVNNSTKVPFISNPEFIGDAATVGYSIVTTGSGGQDGVQLSGLSKLGLPNVIFSRQNSDNDGISANYSGNCFQSATLLTTQEVCSPLRNQVEWEFENGEIIKGSTVSYTFPKEGWNKFKLRFKIFNTSPLKKVVNSQILNVILNLTESVCQEEVYEDSIFIKPRPLSFLPDSVYLCVREGQKDTLMPNAIGDSLTYSWQTSLGTQISTDANLEVVAPAVYQLEILNLQGCLTKDEIEVIEGCEPRLFIPDAFTPNGDSANDRLSIYYAHIEDFNLLIYNRWGELIFESNDPEIRWDGSVKGEFFSTAIYPYVVSYKSVDFPERGVIKNRGSIIVIK